MADIRQNPTPLDEFGVGNNIYLACSNFGTGCPNWEQTDNGVWAPLFQTGGIVICRKDPPPPPPRDTRAASYWSPLVLDGDDQESWGAAIGGGGSGVYWRVQLTKDHSPPGAGLTVDGYWFGLVVGTSGGTWNLGRYTNFGPATLASTAGPGTANANVLLIRRVGNDLQGWRSTDAGANWTMILSATDTTYMTDLQPGLSLADDAVQGHGFDMFGGGPAEEFIPQFYRRVYS